MRFVTMHDLSLQDLSDMANGRMADTVSDVDFLETLAAHHCFLIPPYILQAGRKGALHRVMEIMYTVDGELDKSRMLVAMAARFGRRQRGKGLGGRGRRLFDTKTP